MSLKEALIAYANDHDTNKLVAAADAAGVSKSVKEVVNAGEAVGEGIPTNDGAPKHPSRVPGLIEARAEQQAAKLLQ
jgi:hypothetical protein